MEAAIERFFKIGERGSSLGTEVMAGLTTFLTMAYIVAVNPAMMEAAASRSTPRSRLRASAPPS